MLLIAASVTGIFATDMYTPSLPHMVSALGTSVSAVKLTMTCYISGLCISQLIYGPLSDRYGRRPIMIAGLLVSLLGVMICASAMHIEQLIIGRILQGFGLGAAISLSRSVMTDIATGEVLGRVLSMLSLVYSIAPAIAPVIGGYLQEAFGWRSVFITLTIYSLLSTLLVMRFFPETNAALNPQALNIKHVWHSYRALFMDPVYMVHVLAAGISFALGIVYYIYAPFLLQDQLHYTAAEFGWLSLFVTAAILGGRVLNVALISRISSIKLIFLGSALTLLSGVLMLLGVYLGYFNLFVILGPVTLFALAGGLIFANCVVEALSPFRHISGFAGALYGSIQMAIVFIVSLVAAKIQSDTQAALAGFVLIGGVVMFLSYSAIMFKRLKPDAAV